jgi:uncharacterized protein (DUF1778 family)
MTMTLAGQERRSRRGSERRQRQVTLAARVTLDEEQQIREAARRRGVSVASLIRDAVLTVTAK